MAAGRALGAVWPVVVRLKHQSNYSDMNISLLFMLVGGIHPAEGAMGMLFVFTGLGLVLFIGAIAALIWSIRSGQLDDLDTPSRRMLTDEATPRQDGHDGPGGLPPTAPGTP